jgi:hypothetical protein
MCPYAAALGPQVFDMTSFLRWLDSGPRPHRFG